jgi:hypothetical protein
MPITRKTLARRNVIVRTGGNAAHQNPSDRHWCDRYNVLLNRKAFVKK